MEIDNIDNHVCDICTHCSDDICVARSMRGDIAVLDLHGNRISSVLTQKDRHDTVYLELDPDLKIAYVGRWQKKTIEAFEWPTGKLLWRRTKHIKIYQLYWHQRGLLVRHHNNLCQLLDHKTGSVLEEKRRISDIHVGDGRGPVVLTYRTPRYSFPRRIEFRESLDGTILWTDETNVEFAPQHAVGNDWIAMGVGGPYAGIRTYGRNGSRLWMYDLPEYYGHFQVLAATCSGTQLYALLSGFSKEVPSFTMRFDALTGQVLWQGECSGEHFAEHPISEDRLAGICGVLDTQTLKWTSRVLRI